MFHQIRGLILEMALAVTIELDTSILLVERRKF
jgi:hypothetical protein